MYLQTSKEKSMDNIIIYFTVDSSYETSYLSLLLSYKDINALKIACVPNYSC